MRNHPKPILVTIAIAVILLILKSLCGEARAQPQGCLGLFGDAATVEAICKARQSYERGWNDWEEVKTWFDRPMTPSFEAGAKYWAANRNVRGHHACAEANEKYSDKADEKMMFSSGYLAAKSLLDPIDIRRADPQYRTGFNERAKLLPLWTTQNDKTAAIRPSEPLPPSTDTPLVTREMPSDEIALRMRGGVYRVPVRINDALTLDFTLDSGASDVSIPADVVLTLFRTETLGSGDFIGSKTYVLADGSELPSMTFRLRELRVGSYRLANVTASVGPPTSELLLGQSFLSRFKTWTLDNERHVIALTTK